LALALAYALCVTYSLLPDISLCGSNVPGNIHSPEWKFPGTKVPGNFRSWERKYRGAKSPWTVMGLPGRERSLTISSAV